MIKIEREIRSDKGHNREMKGKRDAEEHKVMQKGDIQKKRKGEQEYPKI